PEVVAAGLLHDTVEDTDVTLAELRARFGPRVAAIVEGCSEPDKRWPWQQRKQYTIDSLREASLEVKLVSAADKLNNLRAIRTEWEAMGEAVWDRFHEGREQQEWYYRNVSASLNSGPHSLADHPLGRTLADEVAAFFGE
ncbi:MAG: bifunctional (p)ppGpp synthetase/guanosine-3',5'-bis(diphosphate) 3'-pyrophosphohydrolase, partial [Chloroflexi bacterium]|nr:bifunctional (p)ppGpp synthetase/guanosine-3',5'-bis(diphosphate) 3'-pyrophosphohydrolase [Chloroflexota bacterium]